MTIDEAIAHAREVAEKQRKDNENCEYKAEYGCKGCADYYSKPCIECAEEYEQLAEWLEELKAIKEMDLSIPQHFTKEQSDWIKTYCIKRNIEFYNKAIDDFVNVCEKQFTTMYGQRYVDMRDIVNIAEQLKAGGNIELPEHSKSQGD